MTGDCAVALAYTRHIWLERWKIEARPVLRIDYIGSHLRERTPTPPCTEFLQNFPAY